MQRAKGVRLWLEERAGRPAIYYIRDGRKKVSTGCTADQLGAAERELENYLASRRRPPTGQRSLAEILMADVMNLYAIDIAPTKASRETIYYHIKALTPFWGEKTLADVKGNTCRSYLKARAENGSIKRNGITSGVTFSTVRRELKTLQAAINHWHHESPLAAVPKVTLPPEGERRERVLERSEVAAMLRAARRLKLNHVARFILIGVYTGTRHAAILGLQWFGALRGGHIEPSKGIIYRRGASERETSKRRPPVSAPRRLLGHINRWAKQDACAEIRHVIHYQGQRILKMKRAWAHVVKEAGLGKDVTPHVLRHTAASWLLWEGRTIWDVAGIIGADASTVQKVYGHHRLDVEQRRRA